MSSRHDNDDTVWAQLTDSAIGRLGGAAIELIARAAAGSRMVGAAQRSIAAWTRLAPPVKYRAAGSLAVAASATHVAMLLPRHPPGAWWLIIPSLAAVFGVALIALSLLAPPAGAAD
jgi:hypothetical protein